MNHIIRRGLFLFSSQQQAILKVTEGQLAFVELNNPAKRNALSNQLMTELSDIITTIQNNPNINCVIIRSKEPGMFCAGADLKERQGLNNFETENLVLNLRAQFQRWYNLPIPTIALMDGPALGGGLELALACDIRVATVNSIIGLPETSLAIIPGAGGTQRLPRLVGVAKAKELIFTAQRITPQNALDIGLINHLTNDYNDALKKCEEIAHLILKNGPIGVRSAKQAINKGTEVDLDSGLSIEGSYYHHVVVSQDRLEGLKSFSEKRKPHYKGQ